MRNILSVTFIFCSILSYAQDILGADLLVDGQASPAVWGYVQIYRTNSEPRNIEIHWGDNTIDTLLAGSLPLLSDEDIICSPISYLTYVCRYWSV